MSRYSHGFTYMTENQQLMKYAADKLATDKLFMSSILHEYKMIFRIESDEQFTDVIWLQNKNFTLDDYYRLCLCGVPNIFSENGKIVIKAISSYTNINPEYLTNLLNTVFSTNSKGQYIKT